MAGLETIPLRIPSRWDPVWFERFVREVLALADPRNAIAGPGISIEGTPDAPATISSSADLEALADQSYVLTEPSSPPEAVANARVLTGETGVVEITDQGPGAEVIIGLKDSGISNEKLRDATACSVLGRASDSNGPMGDIAASANDTVLRRTSDAVGFGAVTPSMISVSAASRLIGRGAGSDAGAGEEITLGSGLSMSGTTLSATSSGGIDHGSQLDDFEDFIAPRANSSGSSSGWSQVNSGAGSGSTQSGTAEGNHPGIWTITTGTTTSGYAALGRSPNIATSHALGAILDADNIVLDAVIRVPNVPDGTQTYIARIGFADELTAAPGDGVMCEIVESTGAKWRLTAYAGGSATSSTATTGPTDNTWHHVRIVANSSGAELLIDGASVATLNTGLPTAGFVWGFQIIKTAGSTARTMDIDMCHVHKTFSTPRY